MINLPDCIATCKNLLLSKGLTLGNQMLVGFQNYWVGHKFLGPILEYKAKKCAFVVDDTIVYYSHRSKKVSTFFNVINPIKNTFDCIILFHYNSTNFHI